MSYKIMDGGFCVEMGIEKLDDAKMRAEDYAREADVNMLTIVDEQLKQIVSAGHATLVMEWSDAAR